MVGKDHLTCKQQISRGLSTYGPNTSDGDSGPAGVVAAIGYPQRVKVEL